MGYVRAPRGHDQLRHCRSSERDECGVEKWHQTCFGDVRRERNSPFLDGIFGMMVALTPFDRPSIVTPLRHVTEG